ncbi:MAG: flagellar hook-length control protein FliK [Phycisphaerae bacterium]|mgnify:CR=1 FL=1|nr:flagellar hook-length control protein FliK [Phycisphaerae bacterium]
MKNNLMLNKTLFPTTTGETSSSFRTRKSSSIDLGEFAGLLNLKFEQPSHQIKNFGRNETVNLKSSHQVDTQNAQIEKTQPDDPKTNTQKNQSNRSSSDSGSAQSAKSTPNANTKENNPTSETTAEAGVNVQSVPESTTDTLDSSLTDKSSSSQTSQLQELIQKLTAQSATQQPGDENSDSIKLSAKSIERNNPNLQSNLNLTNQQIVFETGLAEHFVRLLTDQFDQLKNSISQKSDTAQSDASPSSATVALGQIKTENSQNNLNPTFQQTSPMQSTETHASDNMTKIMHIIRSNLGRRQSQLTVRLDPPELGKMRVDIKVIDSNLTLTITTETEQAGQMLTNRMETLKNSLEQNGINLAKFEVVTRSENTSQNQNDQQSQDQSQNNNGGFNQHQQQSTFNHGTNDPSEQTPTDTPENSNVISSNTDSSNETLNLVA